MAGEKANSAPATLYYVTLWVLRLLIKRQQCTYTVTSIKLQFHFCSHRNG